jgi:hypothetical protein
MPEYEVREVEFGTKKVMNKVYFESDILSHCYKPMDDLAKDGRTFVIYQPRHGFIRDFDVITTSLTNIMEVIEIDITKTTDAILDEKLVGVLKTAANTIRNEVVNETNFAKIVSKNEDASILEGAAAAIERLTRELAFANSKINELSEELEQFSMAR